MPGAMHNCVFFNPTWHIYVLHSLIQTLDLDLDEFVLRYFAQIHCRVVPSPMYLVICTLYTG